MRQTNDFDHVVECDECDGAGEVLFNLCRDDGECGACGSGNIGKGYCKSCGYEGYGLCPKCDGKQKVIKSWVDCRCDECNRSYFAVNTMTQEYISRHRSQLEALISATHYAARNNVMTEVYHQDVVCFKAFGDGDSKYDLLHMQLEPIEFVKKSANKHAA